MSNVSELPTQKRLYDEASLWLAKLDRSLSAEEEQALKLWIAQSGENRAALLKLASLWDKMDSLSLLSELFQLPERQPRSVRRYYAAAAAVLLLAILGWQLGNFTSIDFSRRPQGETKAVAIVDGVYETAVGERSTTKLQDGSLLVLNTNSLIKVLYSDKQRLFILERGEMSIEVAHDQERPLSVMAGQKIVQAVGTAFNVQIINDQEIELIVIDGQVLVAERGDSNATAPTKPLKSLAGNARTVSKGERVVLGASHEAIAKVSESDISVQLSWRQGNVVFRGETLAEAVVELSRYTPVRFELADDELGQIRIGGLFKAGDVDGLLAALRENFNIDYERLDDQRVLLKAR